MAEPEIDWSRTGEIELWEVVDPVTVLVLAPLRNGEWGWREMDVADAEFFRPDIASDLRMVG